MSIIGVNINNNDDKVYCTLFWWMLECVVSRLWFQWRCECHCETNITARVSLNVLAAQLFLTTLCTIIYCVCCCLLLPSTTADLFQFMTQWWHVSF